MNSFLAVDNSWIIQMGIIFSTMMLLLYGDKIQKKNPLMFNLILDGGILSISFVLIHQIILAPTSIMARIAPNSTAGHSIVYLGFCCMYFIVGRIPNYNPLRALRLVGYAVCLEQVTWSLTVWYMIRWAFGFALTGFLLNVLGFGAASLIALWKYERWTLKWPTLISLGTIPTELMWAAAGMWVSITSLGNSVWYSNLQVNMIEVMDNYFFIALFIAGYLAATTLRQYQIKERTYKEWMQLKP